MPIRKFKYDVGLSFAGEQRDYVRQVADVLKERGFKVFFDDYERTELWGKDLYVHLSKVYQAMCEYCVMFISQDYAEKVWTNHERRNAQARAVGENVEYILPVRFDDTPIDGLPNTINYVDLKGMSAAELATVIMEKIRTTRVEFIPPVLDRVYRLLDVEDDEEKDVVRSIAHRFFSVLGRMSEAERRVILRFFQEACPAELPHNLHIHVDLLHRHSNEEVESLMKILGSLKSLGFSCDVSYRLLSDGQREINRFVLDWVALTSNAEAASVADIEVARAMTDTISMFYCEEHSADSLDRLDFSMLSGN